MRCRARTRGLRNSHQIEEWAGESPWDYTQTSRVDMQIGLRDYWMK